MSSPTPPQGPAPAEFATITTDDLVTGEGVALDLPPASLGLRLASGLIDVIVTLTAFLAFLVLLAVATVEGSDALFGAGLIAAWIIAFAALPTTLETLTRGRSLGKLAVGLRTVRVDAGPITFHHALVRALVGVVEIYGLSGVPAFFSMLLSQRGRRLGDYAAGTYVVRDRVALRLSPPASMPPQLATWARAADLATLPTGLALAVRQYVGRLPTLDPSARDRVARDLLGEVGRYVAPPPPADAPAELVLAAVIAERRERDLARLRRDDEMRTRLANRG